MNFINDFQKAMQTTGLVCTDTILADGELHRFAGNPDKPNNKTSWYVLHADNIPAGSYGDWRRDFKKNWCFKNTQELTADEQHAFKKRISEIQEKRNQARLEAQAKARDAAQRILQESVLAAKDHPYLSKKGIAAHGIRQYKDTLLIPLIDTEGQLHSIQFIYSNGEKKFLTDGAIKGNYAVIGEVTSTIYICEGYATGATIHTATDCTVIVAFNAGNLLTVTQSIYKKYSDKNIYICGDNDQWTEGNPGLAKAIEAAKVINTKHLAPDFKHCDLTTKPTDFNDLMLLSGIEEVKKQILTRTGYSKNRLRVVELEEFLAMKFPPRELILSPWLPKAGLCMIHARPGTGKSFLSFGISYAVATGSKFLNWQAEKPRGVLLIDGEMSAIAAQERFAAINSMYGHHPLPAKLNFITPDLQEWGLPDLGTIEGQDQINEFINSDTDLIIVDNLSCLVRTGRENEGESWLPIQTWALGLRAKGKSVLFIHHSGKGGAQRGSSKKEDVLDTVISLTRPEDYSHDQGARFIVNFEKARGFHGDDAKPFEANLTTDQHGNPCWVTRSLEETTYDKVVTMLNDGMSQKDISIELNINKSNVSRYAYRAKEEGLLTANRGIRYDH